MGGFLTFFFESWLLLMEISFVGEKPEVNVIRCAIRFDDKGGLIGAERAPSPDGKDVDLEA